MVHNTDCLVPRCNGGTGRTARAEYRQHTRKVMSLSASIAQVLVFESGENRFKLGELKKVQVMVTLPPLIWPYRGLVGSTLPGASRMFKALLDR